MKHRERENKQKRQEMILTSGLLGGSYGEKHENKTKEQRINKQAVSRVGDESMK